VANPLKVSKNLWREFQDVDHMTRKPIRIGFLLATLALTHTHASHAQPFNIDGQRWTGNTAQSQAQGFSQGDPLRLTWGIAQEGMLVGGGGEAPSGNDIRAFFNSIHGSQATWQPIMASTFDRWASISGLDYSFEDNDDGAGWIIAGGVLGTRADVRISSHSIDGQAGSNTLAYNFFPNVGEQVIDSDNVAFYSDSNNDFRGTRNLLAHETGHGVGMSHLESSNSAQLMDPFISTAFDGPQYFDILSAQRGYGDFNEKSFAHLGNDVSGRATSLGAIADGGSVEIGQDAKTLVVGRTASDFVSIDDTSDTDFYSFSVSSNGTVDINVAAHGFVFNVGPQDGVQSPFDSRIRSDLSLKLFDSGMTELGSSNGTGLGGAESLTGVSLGAGNYFIQVTGLDNADNNAFDVQFYGLTASFTGLASTVPEPASGLGLMLVGLAVVSCRRQKKNRLANRD
jgi:hypothetical protein